MPSLTLIVPYYRNVQMLKHQLCTWANYPEQIEIVLVDDGSPEPALPIVNKYANGGVRDRLRVYRITKDIPWNRGGARNLGSKQAETPWIMHIDIDHVLPPECAPDLVKFAPNPRHWYRFNRFRRGTADETRKKDAIDPKVTYGPIKPHCDSYLCTQKMYWDVGGYDEDYSGCLGGGSPFLKQLEELAKVETAPPPIQLEVYTRSVVKDASDFSLSRDTSEYSRRRKVKEAQRNTKAKNPLRFEWVREL